MVMIPIENEYRKYISQIIRKIETMLAPGFFPLFKYDHRICAHLVEDGYIQLYEYAQRKIYVPTQKGRILKRKLVDPLQRFVLLGQTAPVITKIINEWAQEQAEKNETKTE